MKFIKSNSMKIEILPEQEYQIQSKEGIKLACKEKNVLAFDILDDDKTIGFALLRNFEKGGWFLWDYAIDYKYQGQHYGEKALKELIAMMKSEYALKIITTTYIYENNVAKKLYEKLGFVKVNEINEPDCHEVDMQLEV